MSAHAFHQTAAWFRLRRRAYPIIRASLPASCVNCGRVVLPSDPWQVGHIVDAALAPDRALELSNLGPAHRRCNLVAGGRLGARIKQAKHGVRRDRPKW